MNKEYYNIEKGSKLNISEEAYKAGDYAEKLVAQYFKNKGATVTDTSNDKAFQKQDVDMIIEKGASKIKVEVKYDSYIARTMSICVELRDLTWGTKSWFFTSKADLLVVVPKGAESRAYAVKLADMRKIPESSFNIVKQKDPQSGHWFECGIIKIEKLRELGVQVAELILPEKYITEEGFSSKYIAEIESMIGIWSFEEMEQMGYTIPESIRGKY